MVVLYCWVIRRGLEDASTPKKQVSTFIAPAPCPHPPTPTGALALVAAVACCYPSLLVACCLLFAKGFAGWYITSAKRGDNINTAMTNLLEHALEVRAGYHSFQRAPA